MIKYFEIKRLRTNYLRQCKHFVTLPNEQVLQKIEKYHNLDFLSSNDEYLDKIIIDSFQMNCNDMYALSTSFQNFKYLKTLCLWNVQMDKGAYIAMDKFLSRHKYLEVFQFLYCNCNVENSIYLASILRNSESLEDISLDHNPLRGEGIVNLFLGIKENSASKVKKLSLRYCEASGEFCEAIIPLLGGNKTITELDLCGNFIGQDGVMFLATALMNNNVLKVLNLSSNNITDEQELYGRTLLTPAASKSNLSSSPSSATNNNNNTQNSSFGAGGLVSAGLSNEVNLMNSNPSTDLTSQANNNYNASTVTNGMDAENGSGSGNGGDASSVHESVNDNDNTSINGSGSKSKQGSTVNLDESNNSSNTNNNSIRITTSTLTYLADAVSREESAITHLDLRGNSIGNNGGEIMLEALKARKAIVAAKKKTAPIFICQVTERMKSDIFSKIFDINKYMQEMEKKRGGKKKKGKKGKKGKK
jgi:Ran GTPase-activating protein (RanGAP) involved in mRNA processing and transport